MSFLTPKKLHFLIATFLHFIIGADLFLLLSKQQRNGKKKPLRYITMSFLRSSIVTQTYELAITCHSTDLFLDETETETYWKMDFLREIIDNDMSAIVPRLKKNIFRIRDYEIEEFRLHYTLVYITLLATFFSRVLYRVFELPEFDMIEKEDCIGISFGGYMEELVSLVEWSKEVA